MLLIYYVAASLDGYIADTGGGVDWLEDCVSEGQDYGYAEFFAGIDALVMGRATYDFVATAGDWPYGSKPCRVFTNRPLEPGVPAVEPVAGSLEPVAEALAADGAKRIWIVGGGGLAVAALEAGLPTEMILTQAPVALGQGTPLLPGLHKATRMHLRDQHSYEDGFVQQIWSAL